MAVRQPTDEQLLRMLEAFEETKGKFEHGSNTLTARAIGVDESTIRRWRRYAQQRGLHLSEGAQNAMRNAGLTGSEIRGGWIHNYDDEGKKIGTSRWTAPEIDTEGLLDRIREAFDGIEPAKPIAPPEDTVSDFLAFIPHADVHIGMVATKDHVGRDYNRQIAADRFKAGVSYSIAATPPSAQAVILNAGDLLHANDDTDATPRNKHKLKVEGTHHDNFGLSIELTIYAIDLALQRHGKVTYRGIPGNHDPNIPSPLSYALNAYYRNEPRVDVIVSQDEFWHMNWGDVFLCAHHGHGRNPKDVCAEIPGKWPVEWGKAKEWHYFSAHRHSYKTVPYGPVRHHQLPCVCSLDDYAAGGPWPDDAGMMSWAFHKKSGMKTTYTVKL